MNESDQLVLARLSELETVIERGRVTFIEVGEALAEIRDNRLYRETHATFEAYCRERWGWTSRHANRQIEAAEVVATLGPIGPIPVNEWQARKILTAAREIKREQRQERDVRRTVRRAEVLKTAHPLEGDRFRVFVHDLRAGQPDIATPAAVITDPPYPEEHLPLYGALDAASAALLHEGGSLLAMCGQSHLPRIYGAETVLRYQWTLGYFTPGESAQQFGRKVKSNWKPVLWYVSGKYDGEHVEDTIRSDGNDKRFHEWGQSVSGMAALIERFTVPGDLVYDPFCGGGTTGVAALLTGRLFVGSDIDEACVKQTAARLAEVTT